MNTFNYFVFLGKIKVKIITSREALKRVAGGEDKFQLLSPQETNQFRDLLSSILVRILCLLEITT